MNVSGLYRNSGQPDFQILEQEPTVLVYQGHRCSRWLVVGVGKRYPHTGAGHVVERGERSGRISVALEGGDEGVGPRGGAGGGSFTHTRMQTHLRTHTITRAHTYARAGARANTQKNSMKHNETVRYEFIGSSSFRDKPNQSTHPLHNAQVPTKIHKIFTYLSTCAHMHPLTHALALGNKHAPTHSNI